ncbi:MAG: rhamnulokinase [Thermoguttaceae bacterium]
MATQTYLAIDIGASGGRHLAGHFDGNRLTLEEIHRFENGPIEMGGTFFWNLPGLWKQIMTGLNLASSQYRDDLISVGVDTWGVDFALLGRGDAILSNPVCYRDPRTDGIMERAFTKIPRTEIFRQTGLQFMQFNTLFQLLAMRENASAILDAAESFLMMPDLFHWLLCGEKSNEMTNATTTQCFNPVEQQWAFPLLDSFGIPMSIFRPVSMPGTILGKLRSSVANSTNLSKTSVVLPGSHDTASAVLSAPTSSSVGQTDWAYISLGTWALMGIESSKPMINSVVESFNFTNEGGCGGTTRLLKNVCGLWLLQECRRTWNEAGKTGPSELPLDWNDLTQMTEMAKPLVSFIDPDSRDFLAPTDMPRAIVDYCRRTGQIVPDSDGAILRCAIDSIAMRFRAVLQMCEEISGNRVETIHIVGGGTQNRQLCQATANACGRRVLSGPIEATALGNILMQGIAAGHLSGIGEARHLIQKSFELEEYLPDRQSFAAWNDGFERFADIVNCAS